MPEYAIKNDLPYKHVYIKKGKKYLLEKFLMFNPSPTKFDSKKKTLN